MIHILKDDRNIDLITSSTKDFFVTEFFHKHREKKELTFHFTKALALNISFVDPD